RREPHARSLPDHSEPGQTRRRPAPDADARRTCRGLRTLWLARRVAFARSTYRARLRAPSLGRQSALVLDERSSGHTRARVDSLPARGPRRAADRAARAHTARSARSEDLLRERIAMLDVSRAGNQLHGSKFAEAQALARASAVQRRRALRGRPE